MPLPQLRRIRWAVRATLLLGVAASVLANILHALDNPISQAIAAWPPVALLLTVELISRVPVHRRLLAATRLIATATIAGIAAWVSYWHMAGVAARYGETGASPYLLPLSVDGLIVVASICLVELGGRIASLEHQAATPAGFAPASAMAASAMAASATGASAMAASATGASATGVSATTTAAPILAAATGTALAATAAPIASAAVSPEPAQPAFAASHQTAAFVAQQGTAQQSTAQQGMAQQGMAQQGVAPRPSDEVSHIMVDALPEEPARAQAADPGLIRAAAARTGANPVVAARNTSAQPDSAQPDSASPVPAPGPEMPPPLRRSTAAALAEAAAALPRSTTGFNPTVARGATAQTRGHAPASSAVRGSHPAPAQRHAASPAGSGHNRPSSTRSRRSPAETVALAARIKADHPAITEAELAAELGITAARWRTVRREAAQTTDSELAA